MGTDTKNIRSNNRFKRIYMATTLPGRMLLSPNLKVLLNYRMGILTYSTAGSLAEGGLASGSLQCK